jgi:predicted secreted Zn-dependent protease
MLQSGMSKHRWIKLLLMGAFFCVTAVELLAQHVSCRTNYYAVVGSDLREIHQSMRSSRPRQTGGHDGFAVWNVSWRFNTLYNGTLCRVNGFSTTTAITITLPRWTAPTNATDAVKTEWARYIQALGQHEYGHAQFAMVAAGEIQKAVRALGDDPSCESLKQRVSSVCEGTVQKYKGLDAAYDQKTNHGINDGARLARGEWQGRRTEGGIPSGQ